MSNTGKLKDKIDYLKRTVEIKEESIQLHIGVLDSYSKINNKYKKALEDIIRLSKDKTKRFVWDIKIINIAERALEKEPRK